MGVREDPLPIAIGGLFRCCIQTWRDIAPGASATKEGDTLACSHCNDSMVVRNGEWVWYHDYQETNL